MTPERAEVAATLFAVQQAFEALIVRGLESTGRDDLRRIAALGDELAGAGAGYLAGEITALVHAAREGGDGAARALLRCQTAARVFERVLSLDAAVEALDAAAAATAVTGGATSGEPSVADAAPDAAAATADPALIPVLDELAALIEGLVGSGLTTASRATLDKLGASFREASRLQLLRLATALRYVIDECGRFVADSEQFSARRLAFFANRSWLLARGLAEAIRRGDRAQLARLLLASSPRPVRSLTVAVIGVHKRALLDGSAAFEFRMRALAGGVPRGTRLVWSCVFGARPGVPAEAFLHLPQPQKFAPIVLLEPREIAVTDAAVALDDGAAGRLVLGPRSTVTAGAGFDRWREIAGSDPARIARRIRAHRIDPLDLEVELQDDLVVSDYELGPPAPSPFRADQQVLPLRAVGLALDCAIATGAEGRAVAAALAGIRARRRRPPLYGLVHSELARLVFQPLTALGDDGPHHLMIARDRIDPAALMKTLDFST